MNILRKSLLLFVLIFLCGILNLSAQSLTTIRKHLAEKEFGKAKEKISKLYEKGELYAGTYYLNSLYFLDSANVHRNVDSAYLYTQKAMALYDKLQESHKEEGKIKKELNELGWTSQFFSQQKSKIEKDIFDFTTKKDDSVLGWQLFLDKYPTAAPQLLVNAEKRRNELAYQIAEKENTYLEYQRFIQKFPAAQQVPAAKEKYEWLLYQTETKVGTLEVYEKFLQQYPNTPHRKMAEGHIFRLYITECSPEIYQQFLARYPNHFMASVAWSWIWSLAEDKREFLKKYTQFPYREYAKKYNKFLDIPLYSVLENNKISMINEEGQLLINTPFDLIGEDDRCKVLENEMIVGAVGEKIGAADRTGRLVMPAEYDWAEYIGKSTFLVQKNKKWGAYFAGNIVENDLAEQEKLVIPCKYEDLEAMAENNVIKFKEKEKYGLYFYNGIRLLNPEFDDIARFRNDTLLITKDGEKGFYTPQQLLDWYRTKTKKLPLPLKEYTLSHKVFLKVKYGESYGISLLNGKELIKADKKQVIESKIGWTVEEFDGGWNLYDFSGKLITTEPVQTMQIALPYILFKKNNKWGIMTTQGEQVLVADYDKITVKQNYFIVEKQKKNFLWFHANKPLIDTTPFLKYEVAVSLLPTHEIKEGYVIFQDKKSKKFGMMNTDGKTLVAPKQEQLNFIQDDILLFSQKKLKGLMNNEGKITLPAKYEKITALAPQQFSLFAKKKFGIFIANKSFLVEPQSLTILRAFGQNNFALYTTKNNQLQFTDKKGQPKTKEIFDNIQHWTDSLALVKTGRYWRLYDLVNQKFTVDEFKEYDIFFDTPYEKIAIVTSGAGRGVFSNRRKYIVPDEYSYVRNLNSNENPFFFVERYVSQANLHIILYIDKQGNVVRKQTVPDADYEKVLCVD